MSINKVRCFQCDGFGKIFNVKGLHFKCEMCQGSGMMKGKHIIWKLQGEILYNWRAKQQLTLRKAALKYGIDSSNLSKMERGIIKPQPYYMNKWALKSKT